MDELGGGERSNNPFIVHRQRLDVYGHALASGLDDGGYVDLVTTADAAVRRVDGVGFTVSPLVDLDLEPATTERRATVLAKVETAAPGGSHKARHLFGLLLRLLVDERGDDVAERRELAIASCGNAALGAAVVAKSADWPLRVFVPADADPIVLERLEALDATIEVCERMSSGTGDPCMAALDEAVAAGAVPFTVQGPRCPHTIDGARTLGLELGAQLAERDLGRAALYVQIGGGALATAVMDGLARADRRLDVTLHPVQTCNTHPYVATWRKVAPVLLADAGLADPHLERERAALLHAEWRDRALDQLVDRLGAIPHAMTPWPETPKSVAGGILDDVTYDWRTVMAHQVISGGYPVLVDEDTLVAAADAAAQVEPRPDATGAAGLAGLLADKADTATRPAVVLLTGVDRAVA